MYCLQHCRPGQTFLLLQVSHILLILNSRIDGETGDFEEIYGAESLDESEPQAGQWDAILTCFFIDTVRPFSEMRLCTDLIHTSKAKDIVNYLSIIHRILAPGGIWINAGKLYFSTLPCITSLIRSIIVAFRKQRYE